MAHQPWPKIPGKIDCIPSLPPKTTPNPKDQEEQTQRKPRPRRRELTCITIILQREDHEHQYSRSNELAPKLRRSCHVGRRIGTENPCRSVGGGRDCAQIGGAFECVDTVDIVEIYHGTGEEAAKDLREEIDWEAAPRQLAKDGVGQEDSRTVG